MPVGDTVFLETISEVGSMYVEVYEGSTADCGSLPPAIYCSNSLSTTDEVLVGLTVGNSYLLRFFESGNDAFGTFEFCLHTPTPSCIPATFTLTADYTTCPAPPNINVEVTNLGTAASVDITNNISGSSVLNVGVGTHTLTGFAFSDMPTITVADNGNLTCLDTDTYTLPTACAPCPSSLSLIGTNIGDDSGPDNRADNESSGLITSTQTIDASAIIDYDSAIEIQLLPGFQTMLGAIFEAFIDGCNNGEGGSNAQGEDNKEN